METDTRLEQLVVDLDIAAQRARRRVQDGDRRLLQTFIDPVQHRRWLQTLLREMAWVLDQTARRAGPRTGQRLYVWPGYDSILLDGTRVTFELGLDARKKLEMFGYPVGQSDDGATRHLPTGALFPTSAESIDRATLYFDAALGGLAERAADIETTFSVGGTHNWLALNPNVGGDPLLGFRVQTTGELNTSHQSFPTIRLDINNPLEWGEYLATKLNTECGDAEDSFWPLPARLRGEGIGAYRERLRFEHAARDHRSIRERLYSLWLIGCFLSNPAEILLERRGAAWLKRLIGDLEDLEPERASRLAGLHALEISIAEGADMPMDRAYFTSWSVVTIPYPIADTRSGDNGDEPDELGSGMLLANFDLPPLYSLAIRQWMASYYLSLRQQESAVIRAEREAHKAALYADRKSVV